MAITIAVVGLGLRGRQWVDALRRTPGYELAACVDVEGTVLQKAAAALGIPDGRCFVRLEDALDDTRPQAVIVASSIDNHLLPSAPGPAGSGRINVRVAFLRRRHAPSLVLDSRVAAGVVAGDRR